jgi:phosphoribosylanthranilate isomerase
LRTRIKFCGLVRAQDVDTAVALGVDAVGFVFYPRSPRALGLDEARALRVRLPSWVSAVGLFVNASPEQVQATRAAVGLDVLQFHGDETPGACSSLAGDRPWWRAIRMRGPGDLLESVALFPDAEAFLVDSFHSGYGGSGQSFDWSWIPDRRTCPIILSGGLDPVSVGDAIAQVRPFAVDVSSGIQGSEPRCKDGARMEAFVDAVLRADVGRASAPH